MNSNNKMQLINQIIQNPELMLNKDYETALAALKDDIKNYKASIETYNRTQIESYEDYKKTKKDIVKIKDIAEVLNFFGENINESVMAKMSCEIKKNSKYEIKEAFENKNINDETLISKVENIVSGQPGKFVPFIENKKINLWFDRKIAYELAMEALGLYSPIIFSGGDYTKIVLKEV